MDARHDAFAAAARLALEVREITKREGGVSTVGRVVTRPGVVTAIPGECEITLDQRDLDAGNLARRLDQAVEAGRRIADEEGVGIEWARIWRIEPLPFTTELVEICAASITDVAGHVHPLPSGPLHDAAEMVRAGVPTAMIFVQSLRGLSHTREEDTRPEHLELAVRALDLSTTRALEWAARRPC
jgi:N-carbamoyl-L-amino-acid hydrolase